MHLRERIEAARRHPSTSSYVFRPLVDASPGYSAAEMRIGCDGSIARRSPNQLTVNMCLSGTAQIRDHNSAASHTMTERQICIHCPNEPLSCSWTGELHSFCLLVSPALGEEVLGSRWEDIVARQDHISATGDAQLIHAMTALYRDCVDGMSTGSLFQGHLVNAIVAHVGDLVAGDARRADRLGNKELSRVVAFLEDNIGERISLSAIADVVNLAPTKFCRLFKASTGLSPYQFLLDRRIRRAQRLLDATGTDISDIAASLGFYDQSQFNRLFKRKVGMPPGKYRRLAHTRSMN